MVVNRVFEQKYILFFFAVACVITQHAINAEDGVTQDVSGVQKGFWFFKGFRNLFSFNLKQNVFDPSNTSELIAYPIQSPTKTDNPSEFPNAVNFLSDSLSSSDSPTRSPSPTSFPTQFSIDAYLYIVNSNITIYGSFDRIATGEELKEFEKVFFDYFQAYYNASDYGEFSVIGVNILYQNYESDQWDDRFLQVRRSKRNKNTFVTSSASWFKPPLKQANIVPAEDSLNSPSSNRRLQSSDIIDRLQSSNYTYISNVTDIEALVKETNFISISSPTTVPSIIPLTESTPDIPILEIKDTDSPSEFPSDFPTGYVFPTEYPSEFPTGYVFPTEYPSEFPSEFPTYYD